MVIKMKMWTVMCYKCGKKAKVKKGTGICSKCKGGL